MELHGIPNCDQVRKARKWLTDHGIKHRFVDFKKAGVELKELAGWQKALGWEALLNRRGTTWRGVPEETRERVVDAQSAAELMWQFPSLIKRPVLVNGKRVLAGFNEREYEGLLVKR